jgi:outer membrane protein assembly factor BamD (BamD/ComL family)
MMRSLAAFRPFHTFFKLLTAFLVIAAISGCSTFGDTPDETVGWSAGKLYSSAKDSQADGNYDKAAKYLEKLEHLKLALHHLVCKNWYLIQIQHNHRHLELLQKE